MKAKMFQQKLQREYIQYDSWTTEQFFIFFIFFSKLLKNRLKNDDMFGKKKWISF